MNDTDPDPIPPDYTPPRYGWDYWEEDALARGLDPGLATLGRAVLRVLPATTGRRYCARSARI